MRSLPQTSTNKQQWESNPTPSDPVSFAIYPRMHQLCHPRSHEYKPKIVLKLQIKIAFVLCHSTKALSRLITCRS